MAIENNEKRATHPQEPVWTDQNRIKRGKENLAEKMGSFVCVEEPRGYDCLGGVGSLAVMSGKD